MNRRQRENRIIAAFAALGLGLAVLVFTVGRSMMNQAESAAVRPQPAESPRTWVTDAGPASISARAAGADIPGYKVLSVLNVRQRMRYGQFIWNELGVGQGKLWVRVDLRRQLISVFRDGHEIGTAVILYGAAGKPTPAGTFSVLEKAEDYHSRTYDAPMPFMLRLTEDGVAIHASDVKWGKATHGCIGVPREFARRLYRQMGLGDRVTIADTPPPPPAPPPPIPLPGKQG